MAAIRTPLAPSAMLPRKGVARWAAIGCLAALAALGGPAHESRAQTLAQAQGAQATERMRSALVKAAFLHKFFSFVEWPEGTFARPDTPVRIGVMGDEEVYADLNALARDRPRDGRPVTVVRLLPGDPVTGVHILYVKADTKARASDVLAAVPEGVLTVGDVDSAHPRGSVMSFFMEDDRVRFGVSLEAAARQKLRLNARLLSVARRIQGSAGMDRMEVALLRGWRG
ncbi:YfiR family protein [Caenimonas koreensis]|uniref:YfiR family protein n=1 Tax=Caenimonas koreensis TaxID=367474 RepID=UPI003784F9B8